MGGRQELKKLETISQEHGKGEVTVPGVVHEIVTVDSCTRRRLKAWTNDSIFVR
jgi:hypothetical protein